MARLQPISAAIRLVPQPSARNRGIAATSSGVRITPLRGSSPRGAPCPTSARSMTSSVPVGGQFLMSSGDQLLMSSDSRLGHRCGGVAPTPIPRQAGDRVKDDRRDAPTLAQNRRAGHPVEVWVFRTKPM